MTRPTIPKKLSKDQAAACVAQFVGIMNGDERFDPRYPEYDPFEDVLGPPRKRKQKRYSLTRAIKHARKIGVDVAVAPDGTITFHSSGQTPAAASITVNSWDEILPDAEDSKRPT